MRHIKIKKGLDIPLEGAPSGAVHVIAPPKTAALNLTPFEGVSFKLLVKPGDPVNVGSPLAEDKKCPGRFFVSPAHGTVKEIVRGEKRVLHNIVVELAKGEEYESFQKISLERATRQQITEFLLQAGLFAYIRRRPFNLLADPSKPPRSIFVKAIESAPFTPSAELQIEGHETEFAAGLKALAKLTDGPLHLIYRSSTSCSAFTQASSVERYAAEGPHPVANASLHIHLIDPIEKVDDLVWTVTALDVVRIGYALTKGRILNERLISIAGSSVLPEKRGFYRVRDGSSIHHLIRERLVAGDNRLISGDPLMGERVDEKAFLTFYSTVLCAIPESHKREFLHFLRLGGDRYTASAAYLSGHYDNTKRRYALTTSLQGEPRAFVTGDPYDKVMPMKIPSMPLVKALMADDFEQAEAFGLLEVDSEDFALATFVCPSKIEQVGIVRKGLRDYATQVLQ